MWRTPYFLENHLTFGGEAVYLKRRPRFTPSSAIVRLEELGKLKLKI
jgi:hypothetical protein